MKRLLEKELLHWKERKEHLPLLLRGARQVGKSYLVQAFGKSHFNAFHVVDFEREPEFKTCFHTKDPKEILRQLEIILQKKIVPGSDLLFFDEIQECPEALVSLRYFKELMPELHVIAAGSLMEFLLNDHTYSFPVGRVEFLYLRPLSFLEFLMAAAPLVAERLQQITLNNPPLAAEHHELLKWLRRYLLIGGMPAAIEAYLSDSSFLESGRAHHRILQAYESDFGKYADHVQHKYLQMIFHRAPALVGKVLKYTHIDREARSRELKPALTLLTNTGLILQVFATCASGVPLHAHIREHRFKLQFLDVGLLQSATHLNPQDFYDKEILQINAGMIGEQFVAQELLASQLPFQNTPLLFWEGEEGGQAEIDFVIQSGAKIVPIEVKAGKSGTLRSLHSFIKQKKTNVGVRLSEQPLQLQENILSIPLYLTHQLPTIIRSL